MAFLASRASLLLSVITLSLSVSLSRLCLLPLLSPCPATPSPPPCTHTLILSLTHGASTSYAVCLFITFIAYKSKGLLASQMAAYVEKVDSKIEQRCSPAPFEPCFSKSGDGFIMYVHALRSTGRLPLVDMPRITRSCANITRLLSWSSPRWPPQRSHPARCRPSWRLARCRPARRVRAGRRSRHRAWTGPQTARRAGSGPPSGRARLPGATQRRGLMCHDDSWILFVKRQMA